MKTFSKFSKLIAVIAIFAMVLSFASCDLLGLGGGSLELVSFTVDKTTIKTSYLIGEAIDFSGIKATVKYSDESLNTVYTYDDLNISYADDITATVGEKDVTVSFQDPHLNVEQKTVVKIKVTAEPVISDDPMIVTQFEQPDSLTAFYSANASAGASKYGSAAFAGEFAVGNVAYVIGNENAFKLNPKFTALDNSDGVLALENFYSVVKISAKVDGEYVVLTTTAGEGNSVAYYNGETLIATVDTYKGEYLFSADAAGLSVKIEVLPSDEYFIYDGNAVVLEANVIKAFNVYEATDLAVIDNYNEAWAEIKTANGLADVVASGIVLHADIEITANDVPASFFLTTDKEVVYTNSVTNEQITIPAGTKYYKDWSHAYHRVGADDFVIEGNLFTIDASDFPLIASPAVFGLDGTEDDYGSDFSNATLFKFDTDRDSNVKPEDIALVNINNIALIGNTGRDNLVDADGNLASAGGLILMKSSYYTTVTVDNVINNSFFIAYFTDSYATINAYDVKCYDSYQNAAMVWGDSFLTFDDSYLNGSGGPVIIAQSVVDQNRHPVLTVNNTKVETHVTGQEIWFTSINANAIVSSITALGNGLQSAGLGNFVDSNGEMNIKGLLMRDGTDASVVISGVDAQGSMFFDGKGIDRTQSAENVNWAYIMQINQYAMSAGSQLPPFFTVYDASGAPQTIYFNGTTFVDLAGNALSLATHAELCTAFATADTITLTQGGISITFDFYH